MSQMHARICLYKPKKCQLWPYDLSACSIMKRIYERPQNETISIILSEVCEFHKLTIDQLKLRTRMRYIVKARQIAMYLLSKHTKLTLKAIGEMFNGMDHTTILHSSQTVKDLMITDKDYANELTQLETKIKYML